MCMSKLDAVRVFNENRGLILTITAGLSYPGGMAISTNGHLYIADVFNNRIVVTTKDGYLLGTVGTLGTGEGEFRFPCDVAIGPDGLLYVADTYNGGVQVLTLDGQFVKKKMQGTPLVLHLEPMGDCMSAYFYCPRFWYLILMVLKFNQSTSDMTLNL